MSRQLLLAVFALYLFKYLLYLISLIFVFDVIL